MDISSFTDKERIPDDANLMDTLSETYPLWQKICQYVHIKYPIAENEWNHSGEKYGWNYRIKDKRRAIIYLLPRDSYFMVAFVFGEKATNAIMQSQVSENIKLTLAAAKPYAEGRGIRIEIKDCSLINDIRVLIDIKIIY